MTPAALAGLQTALEARQAELEKRIHNREEIAVDSSADMLDQTQYASQRDMAAADLERESASLREVRAALRRIQRGTFGICVDCAEEISRKRLAAVPWTASCLACREAADPNGVSPRNMIENPLLPDA
jgi:DnaK suppressor protein